MVRVRKTDRKVTPALSVAKGSDPRMPEEGR
jgi:hypothetical protein